MPRADAPPKPNENATKAQTPDLRVSTRAQLSNVGKSFRNAVSGGPKTVDRVYDERVQESKAFEAGLKRVRKHYKPLLQHMKGFTEASIQILDELKRMSPTHRPLHSSSRASPARPSRRRGSSIIVEKNQRHIVTLLNAMRDLYAGLRSKVAYADKRYGQIAGLTLTDTETLLSRCKELGKRREQCRSNFDRKTADLAALRNSVEQKRYKGNHTPDDYQKIRGLKEKVEELGKVYGDANKEAKMEYRVLLDSRADTVYRVVEGLSQAHRGFTTGLVETIQAADRKMGPILKLVLCGPDHNAPPPPPTKRMRPAAFGALHTAAKSQSSSSVTVSRPVPAWKKKPAPKIAAPQTRPRPPSYCKFRPGTGAKAPRMSGGPAVVPEETRPRRDQGATGGKQPPPPPASSLHGRSSPRSTHGIASRATFSRSTTPRSPGVTSSVRPAWAKPPPRKTKPPPPPPQTKAKIPAYVQKSLRTEIPTAGKSQTEARARTPTHRKRIGNTNPRTESRSSKTPPRKPHRPYGSTPVSRDGSGLEAKRVKFLAAMAKSQAKKRDPSGAGGNYT